MAWMGFILTSALALVAFGLFVHAGISPARVVLLGAGVGWLLM